MTPDPSPTGIPLTDEELAERFHAAYERLAPHYGYVTRPETRAWAPTTPNGRLMLAVIHEAMRPELDRLTDRLTLAEGALLRCCHDSFSDGDGAYRMYLEDAAAALSPPTTEGTTNDE